jgi:hypothetical protein
MADDKFEPREINFRQWLPWTQIFRGFWIALDHKKLLLAAAGILAMSLGWWFISSVTYSLRKAPEWAAPNYGTNWEAFKKDRARWNLFYEAAGPDRFAEYDENDLANDTTQYEALARAFAAIRQEAKENPPAIAEIREKYLKGLLPPEMLASLQLTDFKKPAGRLRTLPWFEDRGPNQFLLVTGHAGHPWREGGFRGLVDWFVTDQVPVLLEPLVKLFRPVKYFLHPNAGFAEQFYFLIVMIWTVGVWAIFGGAITRIAAVEIARNEKIGLGEALRFTIARWKSYIFASFFPLLIIAFIVLLLAIFGLVNYIPILAEFWNGILWFLVLLGGLTIAVLLVGLVGWPMIHSTLSAEGSDSFDALSRSYSYVLQKPWSYAWYVAVALAYGAVVVFFVGLMGSLTVYLGKWGVSQFTGLGQYADPSHMFVWAPTSYHWRDLLLQGSPIAEGAPVVTDKMVEQYVQSNQFRNWYYIGAFLIAAWLYLIFLLLIGFGYSYFWSASTMIYLLMRRKVDDTEMDEVYLEEEDSEEPYSTTTTTPAATPEPSSAPMQLVEPPTLRQPAPAGSAAPPAAPLESTAPKPGDGEAAPGGSVTS